MKIDCAGVLRGILSAAFICLGQMATAVELGDGWILDGDASTLRFQSVKNTTVVESSTFAGLVGLIDDAGVATIKVDLDSIQSNVDLRNVRLRFLFFKTFENPQSTIKVNLDPADYSDLGETRRKQVSLPYSLELNEITRDRSAEIAVTLLTDDLVSVSSTVHYRSLSTISTFWVACESLKTLRM